MERKMEESPTKLKKRNAFLEAQNRQLMALLDAMADPAYICSADFHILYLNRAMAEAFELTENELCYEAFQKSNAPCHYCPMREVIRGDEVRQERCFPSMGRTFELVHTPLQLGTGTPQKLAVMRDITERKIAQQKLEQAYRELDSFIYTVAHDLRSPLTPIIGFAQLLRDKYNGMLQGEDLVRLDEIGAQGNRIHQMLKDLLDLARTGRLEAPETPVELEEVMEELRIELCCRYQMAQLPLVCAALPAVRIPKTLLLQVLENLVENALNYGEPSKRPIEVEAGLHEGLLRISVRDFGPGVPSCEQKRIFELFSRGSTGAGKNGTGIGLASVRKIARLYSGQAFYEPTPGGGSTFIVELKEPGGS